MIHRHFVPDLRQLNPFIKNAFEEDIGDGDHTTLATIPINATGKAKLLIKDKGILAGVTLAEFLLQYIDQDLRMTPNISDGSPVKEGEIAFWVEGKVHSILKVERVLLNCMQRMSGIATLTHILVDKLKSTHTQILDTRKTTPGFRYMEKWAVFIGGGVNHRFGLYDMILIKDNHIDFAGGIPQALSMVQDYLRQIKKPLKVEIEVRSFKELDEVLAIGGIDRILLDNFELHDLKKAVSLVGGKFPTEASGGISPENALDYALTGVDFISLGALTHSHPNFDLSLKAV
jgi:nicotinate-nucleotide pyrophosphorylase (carboxylating)